MNRTRLPPGPTSLIPGRLLFEMIRSPLRFLENAARTYGDVVYFKLGPSDDAATPPRTLRE